MRRLTAPPEPPPELTAGLDAIRDELGVPGEFPPEAQAEAEEAARAPLPEREDRRNIELFTIDPPGSMDLDQAMALERRPGGYRIRYAIADVGAFVKPGGALDAEAHRRVMTRYLPDRNAPRRRRRCCAVPATSRSTARRRRTPCTQVWRRRTRTSPHRCAGWPTATPPRCA